MMNAKMNILEIPDTLPPLRDYQQYCYDYRMATDTNQIICIPTGGGKGNIIVRQVIDNIRSVKPTLVIVPTEELLVNLEVRLRKHAPYLAMMCHFISGSRKDKEYGSPYVFVTYQSLYKNLDKTLRYHHVIYDEAHTSAAITPLKCLKHYPDAIHTGYTATPGRLDNKPLDDPYQEINMSPLSVRDMINRGYLAGFEIFGVPLQGFLDAYANRDQTIDQDGLSFQQSYLANNQISEQIYENWAEVAYNTKTIGFASGVEHAEMLTEMFNSKFSTKRFAFMHNKMKYTERKAMLQAFHDNNLLGIFNINMLCMGVDVPDARTALLCRKTQSDVLHRQQMGRILRPKPDGSNGLIIDCVGNVATHGSPTTPKEYSLKSDPDEKISNPNVVCPCCTIPMATRSVFVRAIKAYAESGNLNTPLILEIDEPKEQENEETGELILVYNCVLKCDNCENVFNRKFHIVTGTYRREFTVTENNKLGKLQKIDHEAIDSKIVGRRLERLLKGTLSTQKKRERILTGQYDIEQKYHALIYLGETVDAARMFLGMDEEEIEDPMLVK